jgi:hypothetical protein
MTISRTTPSQRIGLTHIDCEPVWEEDEIILFDMYTKDGVWLGSKRLLRYCEEFNDQFK